VVCATKTDEVSRPQLLDGSYSLLILQFMATSSLSYLGKTGISYKTLDLVAREFLTSAAQAGMYQYSRRTQMSFLTGMENPESLQATAT